MTREGGPQSIKHESFKSDEIYYFNTHRPLDLVKNLENRYTDFPLEKVKDIFQQTLGLEIKNIKPDTNFGTGHVIFFAETEKGRYVFRANYGVASPEHYMSLEGKFNLEYQKADIPVGVILHSDSTRSKYNFDYQILEPLPGKDLETEWAGTEKDYENLCIELGRLVARQYKAPVSGFGRFMNLDVLQGSYKTTHEYLTAYLDFDLATLLEYKIIDEGVRSKIQAVFMDNKPIFDKDTQGYLVHHDLADHNLRYEGDKIMAVFDWENAVAFDPISELGSAHTWLSHYDFKRKKMLEGFTAELGHEPENLHKKISIYFLRTMLWKVCFALRRGKFTERHKNLLEQSLKENGL
ncbi:MAG: aminoglycoside phosphotransferase family protein [Candidatus Pacebacteria bacterium]|nr:aminoglycoside phosphotransferase family protein [Candidatus Paceibacterota bacterium]